MPEFYRIDEFSRTPDGVLDRRDLSRLLFVGFDIQPVSLAVCPVPPAQRFFRIDEFSAAADGELDVRDRTRYTSLGFDIGSTQVCSNITVYVNAPGITVLVLVDRDVLKEVQLALIEDPIDSGESWTSGLWSVTEVIDYLNQRQAEFLKLTGVRLTRARVVTVPQVQRHPLPGDWIATQRVVFLSPNGARRMLHRADPFELDHGLPAWESSVDTRPKVYTDGMLPTGTVQIAPKTQDGGVLELLYVAVGTSLSNTGVPFQVPAEFVAPIKWGVVATMLGKVGRANDAKRAEYAEMRFQEGVEAAKMILEGWA